MLLTIEGYRSNNRELMGLIKQAAEFFAKELLGPRMSKNIYVDLKLTKDLKKKEKAYGFCHVIDDNLNRPREFYIELDASMRFDFTQILTWLAHEMVHLKQWVRKELCDYELGRTQWKSRMFKTNDDVNQPWEKEAYRLESPLYEKFEEWYYDNV